MNQDNTNRSFYLAEIIRRHINGTISIHEQSLLDEWLSEDVNHPEMLKQFCRSEFLQEQIEIHAIFDIYANYDRFLRAKRAVDRKRTLRRWTISSAASLLVVMFCVWGLRGRYDEVDSVAPQIAKIEPGTSRATLVLADGRQVELTDSVNTDIVENGSKIAIKGQQLGYQSDQNPTQTIAYNTLITPRKGEYRLTLSEGTRVWIGPQTQIKYPVAFASDKREVWITGEAYFEVAKDAAKPFFVNTTGLNIRVLGTSFNVRSYAGEAEQTTLAEGIIEVRAAEKVRILEPGDQLSMYGGEFQVNKVDASAYLKWKNERFIFHNDPLEEVILKLERWYDISFQIEDHSLRDMRFTGSIPKYGDLSEVVEMLEMTTKINFEQVSGKIFVLSE